MRYLGARRPRLSPSRLTVAALLFLLGLVTTAGTVSAHALLLRATPAADTVLRSSPASVHLWFSEDLNGSASGIVVWDHDRHVMTRGNAVPVPGQSRQMEIALKPLPPGAYLVLWTSVSAQDGHVLRGSYLFYVKRRGPGPSLAGVPSGNNTQGFPDATTLLDIVTHWCELLGATLWLGSSVFSALIVPRGSLGRRQAEEGAHVRTVVQLAIVGLVLASCAVLLLQTYSLTGQWSSVLSMASLKDVFGAQYGRLWIVRQLLALLALTTTLFAARAGESNPRRYTRNIGTGERGAVRMGTEYHPTLPLVLLGLVYLYALAASGHASSADIGPLAGSHIVSVAVIVDWLHLVGTTLWFGGQLYIVLVLIPTLRPAIGDMRMVGAFLETLDRFSPLAFVSVALFTLSGPFNGAIHIPSWYAFFSSVYGRTLIVKVALIGLMILTSTLTVFVLRPHIRTVLAGNPAKDVPDSAVLLTRLFAWLRIEPMLGLGVLLATSVMFYYPVPAGFAPAGPNAYSVQASGVTATVTVKPDRSGPNAMTVQLHDAHGRPVEAHVTVLTTMLDMPMGTGLASLQQTSAGTYGGTVDLAMGGHWKLELLIYVPSGNLIRMTFRAQVAT